MAATPTVEEVKTFLQISPLTTTHDALLQQLIPAAVSNLEQLSGRRISSSSNVETIYSTNGESSVVIHDRPYSDPSRTVTMDGSTFTEGTDVWFIQDRRSEHITSTIQTRMFTGGGDGYKADPDWWHKNLDIWWGRYGESGMPNNLAIRGIIGMPILTDDTWHAIVEMTGYLFRQKDSAANITFGPDGSILDIGDLPTPVQVWITNWRIRTAVAVVG